MEEKIIECIDLIYKYDIEENVDIAVDNISFKVKAGEFVVILGRNGSGKSTLAKHINSLLLPSVGTIYVDGMNTLDLRNTWNIRHTAGMVFQNPDNQIVAAMVEEDVAFGPENLGIESLEIRARVNEALKIVDMYDYRKHAPHFLSGGQKQRIAIAGIIAMRPKCIVLDEPTSMIDPLGRKEIINTVKRLNDEYGITIILITHCMEEAVGADRILVMDNGKLIMDGTPRNIFSQIEELKIIGLDVPKVTELAYQLKSSGVDIKPNILTIDEMVDAICQLK